MSKAAVELRMGSLVSGSVYDQDELYLPEFFEQKTGALAIDKWAGPKAIQRLRLFEQAGSIALTYPMAIRWSTDVDWVFFIGTAAATTMRVGLATYNRVTGVWSYQGVVTLTTPPGVGNHTARALRVTYDKHTVGTVTNGGSGTTITGTGTLMQTNRVAIGSRIGFGTQDPAQVGVWYEITGISADGTFTIDADPGNIAGGTQYVVEEIRLLVASTNATAANGGLNLAKGIRFENFVPGSTVIPAAVATDNIRAVYHLRDASPNTLTTAAGLGLQDKVDFQNQILWFLDRPTTTSLRLAKFNIRAALTVASGETQSAFVFLTATTAGLTGTISQANNGRLANAGHGPGVGVDSIYFTTTSRIYRIKDVSTIVTGDTNFIVDWMTEIPPGGASSFNAGTGMNSIEYSSYFDRFIVFTTYAATSMRCYLLQYTTDGAEFERALWADTRQSDQTSADNDLAILVSPQGSGVAGWIEGGLLYICSTSPAIGTGQVWAVPVGADWEYVSATGQRMILPRMATPNCDEYLRVFVNSLQVVGGASGQNLGSGTEPYRIYYRTSGIDDDSGAWTLIDQSGDFPGGISGTEIQFALEFRVLGPIGIPARIHSVAVVYNNFTTDDHYQPSVGKSSVGSKIFAWRHAVAFGTTVPALRIRLFDAVTGGLLLDDDTDSEVEGTFERSTDGSTWVGWTNADKANETTYVRYTPTDLADNIKVKAVLTLA